MSHSQFRCTILILTHAWLNLWDKHITPGRINQVSRTPLLAVGVLCLPSSNTCSVTAPPPLPPLPLHSASASTSEMMDTQMTPSLLVATAERQCGCSCSAATAHPTLPTRHRCRSTLPRPHRHSDKHSFCRVTCSHRF